MDTTTIMTELLIIDGLTYISIRDAAAIVTGCAAAMVALHL
jgi:hypothetical protein